MGVVLHEQVLQQPCSVGVAQERWRIAHTPAVAHRCIQVPGGLGECVGFQSAGLRAWSKGSDVEIVLRRRWHVGQSPSFHQSGTSSPGHHVHGVVLEAQTAGTRGEAQELPIG